MPCDTINIATVTLGKVDEKHLAEAMKVLGFTAWDRVGSTKDNTVIRIGSVAASPELTATIKKEITRQSIKAAAKRFGWGLKELPDGKLQLQKVRAGL